MWTLNIRNLDRVTITFFVFEIIYCFALGMIKISITFMYFRILEGRRWKYVLWVTQVFNVLVISSFLIGLFLSCKPLARYWASSYDAGGNCPDLWNWNGYYLAFNLFLDVWLIAIPSSYVWKTSMERRNKIAVIAMFCLGLMYVPGPRRLGFPTLPRILKKVPFRWHHGVTMLAHTDKQAIDARAHFVAPCR